MVRLLSKKAAKIKKAYNSRMDEGLGEKSGRRKQAINSRRDEEKGSEKSMGRKAYRDDKGMQ